MGSRVYRERISTDNLKIAGSCSRRPRVFQTMSTASYQGLAGHPPTMNWFLINKVLPRGGLEEGRQRVGDDQRLESVFFLVTFFLQKNDSPGKVLERRRLEEARQHSRTRWAGGLKRQRQGGAASGAAFHKIYWN